MAGMVQVRKVQDMDTHRIKLQVMVRWWFFVWWKDVSLQPLGVLWFDDQGRAGDFAHEHLPPLLCVDHDVKR